MTSLEKEKIAGVFVTQDVENFGLEFRQRVSEYGLDFVFLVINNESTVPDFQIGNFSFVHSRTNLGGAGGFALGMTLALNSEASWIWTCDDDAYAETKLVAQKLLEKSVDQGFDLLAPIILSPWNQDRLSFPYRGKFKRIWTRGEILKFDFVRNQAHLFNGTLFKVELIKTIGIPDSRLFIRGDEQEYLLRILRANYKVGTTTQVAMIHPSSEDELYPTLFGILRTPIPQSMVKFSFQIRNRGYITRKYLKLDWLFLDIIRYISFFLLRKDPQFSAFGKTLRLYLIGFHDKTLSDFKHIDDYTWGSILKMVKKIKSSE